MTVSTTLNKIVFTGDGSTSTFSFPFAVRAGGSTDIEVFQTDTSGNITQLTYGTQYTVTLNAAIAPNPTPVGGSITTTAIPALGTLVTILRVEAETQGTSLANQGTAYQPVIEGMGDYITMLTQQIAELQGRAISVAVSDPAPTNLPPVAQRANLVMGFDASGNPTAVAAAPTGVISSAMAPFVGSSTLAAAKALLGYGSMANENIGAAGKGIIDDGTGNARVNRTVTAVTTNQSPGSAQHMTDYVSSGTLIFTLPKLSTVFNGYELYVFCITGSATLSPNASDNFPTTGGGVSVVLIPGQFARLVGDGVSQWTITLGFIPSFSTNKPAFALLNVLTANNSATLSDTSSLTGNYSLYRVFFENLIPVTTQRQLQLQIHTGGAFKSTGYLSTENTLYGGTLAGNAATTCVLLTGATTDSNQSPLNSAPGINGYIDFINPSANAKCMIAGQTYCQTAAVNVAVNSFGGFWNTAGVVDGFQILMDSGNISSGIVKIYGVL